MTETVRLVPQRYWRRLAVLTAVSSFASRVPLMPSRLSCCSAEVSIDLVRACGVRYVKVPRSESCPSGGRR